MSWFSFSRNIGIDFGTSRTRLYVPNRGIIFDEPSLISFSTDGKEVISIGEHSEELKGRVSDNIIVHSVMERGVIQHQEYAEIYLKEAMKRVRGIGNVIKSDSVINVSLANTSMEVRSLLQACKSAGVRNIYSDYSVLFASLGSGSKQTQLHGRMIANIGAGTTEVAVISFGGINNSGFDKIGGIDMDQDIVNHVLERYGVHISLDVAKQVKETVGSVVSLKNEKEIQVTGNDVSKKLPKVITLTSNDVQEATEETVDKIINVIAHVFRDTPPELTSDIIDHGIILTGGVANMPHLAAVIQHAVNAPVKIANDPELCVIRGIGKSIKNKQIDFHKQSLLSK